jgi:DNA-binding transcriptional LysR family regulator
MADEVAELQLFVEIVKAGNLSAAARALNSSPAAMSRGLSALESRLSVRLVTRMSKERGKRFELPVSGSLTTTSGEVVHNWVRAGRGIALKAVWDIQPDLVAGTIVECLKDFWCDEIDLFAICANRQHLSPRIRVFLDYVSATLPKMVQKESRIPLQESSPSTGRVGAQASSQKIRRK